MALELNPDKASGTQTLLELAVADAKSAEEIKNAEQKVARQERIDAEGVLAQFSNIGELSQAEVDAISNAQDQVSVIHLILQDKAGAELERIRVPLQDATTYTVDVGVTAERLSENMAADGEALFVLLDVDGVNRGPAAENNTTPSEGSHLNTTETANRFQVPSKLADVVRISVMNGGFGPTFAWVANPA